jgi:hypothetical protein
MSRKGASSLKRMFDDGFSLAPLFNAGSAVFGRRAEGRLKSGAGAEGEAKSGQTSLFGLNPIPLERKLQQLQQMIKQGKISLANGLSMDSLKHELSKPENNGLGVLEMVSHLKLKKMLSGPKAPAAAFKALAPAM